MAQYYVEKGYRVLAKNEGGEVTLYATKGVMGSVGAHMAHLSATVIVLGGLLGSYYGFQEFGVCLEGQTYHIPRGNFDLKVEKFWIDYHENGAVKRYNSTLTVLEGGESKMTKTITVNDPLVYKGIWFYQSSYGDAWDQIESRSRQHQGQRDREGRQDYRSGVAERANAVELNLKLADDRLCRGFCIQFNREKSVFKDHRACEPGDQTGRSTNGALCRRRPGFSISSPTCSKSKIPSINLNWSGTSRKSIRGCRSPRTPASTSSGLGSTMIVVGITLSSFIYHRRLWTKIIPSADGVTVHVGGTTHKSQIDFQKEFRKLPETIRSFRA